MNKEEKQLRESLKGFGCSQRVEYILDEFFESNVVIPKGATLQYYDGIQCKWIDKINIYEGTEYRIKPSEPVYEWQWLYKHNSTSEMYIATQFFMTDDEATEELDNGFHFFKIEETKRVRQ